MQWMSSEILINSLQYGTIDVRKTANLYDKNQHYEGLDATMSVTL